MKWKGLAYYFVWFFAGEDEANKLWNIKKELLKNE
jgi:hypothetical protein